LSGMLDAFRMEHPMISIVLHDVKPSSIADLLLSGALDGAFCARHGPPHPQLHYANLFEEAMVIAFPPDHEFSERDYVPLNDVTEQNYIDRLHCEFREEVNESFRDQDLQLDVVFRSEREDWIQSLVRDGIGITCIPRYSLLRPELDHRPIVDPVLSRKVDFVVADQAENIPALNMLREWAIGHDWPEYEPATSPTE
uniref:LysR family transcriptional regulator substrate-binding protein n=1 Tax=Ruegeria lacuscaerulensis TaxID=55218 RepID=UPI00147D7954